MTDFHGWEAGALWEDYEVRDRITSRDIERLAMIGEKKWQQGMATFCKPFTKATIRYFDHADAAERGLVGRSVRLELRPTRMSTPTGRSSTGADRRRPRQRISARSSRCAAASWTSGSTSICRRSTRCCARETKGEIVIEVLAQRDAHHVRGIALTPTQGLARGMAVEDTGGPLKAPVGKGDSLAHVRRVRQRHRPRSRRCPTSSGAPCIGLRRRWRDAPPSPRSSRRASRSSTCSCRWSAAARRGSSAGRAWARRCCSPK